MIRPLLLTPFFLLISAAAVAEEGPKHRLLSAVPFTDVTLADEFWTPRIETNRTASLPHNIEWCRKTGRIDNFANAAKKQGKFRGLVFNDSDLYKVLEAASYSLAAHPDPALDKTVDEIIAKIAAAQQPDGYLNTYFTLAEPGKRLTNLRYMHELYCCGHLIEAAVAHFRATGKRTLLDVAIKYADFIDGVFGPTKRQGVPGHEEIELALVKVAQVTGQEKYAALAKYFIDTRGDKSKREIWGEYHQDHLPVRQQSEIVGHAVRAMYLYSRHRRRGRHLRRPAVDRRHATALAGCYAAKDVHYRRHRRPLRRRGLWQARRAAQRHGLLRDLRRCWPGPLGPSAQSAARRCPVRRRCRAGGLQRHPFRREPRWPEYFYVNPLASDGRHHREPFFDCACCPPNVARFLASLPGYAYAAGKLVPT